MRTTDLQGFSIATVGDSRRVVVDCDGLALMRVASRLSERASARSVTAENPSVEGCGGDPSVRGPVEAAKRGGDTLHPERTVLPDEEVR
jgi:serine/threonine protein phosphatase PrpC